MSIYLDATDPSKNIDLLLDPESKLVTKEYVDAEALRSKRNSEGVIGITIIAIALISMNIKSRTGGLIAIFGVVSVLSGLRGHLRYIQASKLPGNDLDEVYQKIGSKVEEIATSEIPEEKQMLLRKIEVIRQRFLYEKTKQVEFDHRLARVQEQLESEGMQLSNQDHVEIISDYLKGNKHKDLILHLICAAQSGTFEFPKISQITRDHYHFDRNKDCDLLLSSPFFPLFLFRPFFPLLIKVINVYKSKDIQEVDITQLPKFLEDKKDFELLLELIFKIAKGTSVANPASVKKILKKYREEKHIGMETNHSALVHN